jgi:2-(1,2-epoxy-1,2-dihydrophenyl)acetyl-CoA isomerase
MSDPILLEVGDGLARLTLNRPASLNAVNAEMAARWRDLALQVTSDPAIGAVLLDAAGPAFCAGGDMIEMASSAAGGAGMTALAGVINEGIAALVAADVPIAAAVQGAVAGGGLGLMLVADHIVASESATFASRYADVGLTPDLGVTTFLPRAIGERRALQLLLTDLVLDARTALEWGLVSEVASPDRVSGRAEEVARSWLDNAAFGQARRLVRAGGERPFAASLVDEAATIGAALDTDNARTRIAAFAARRDGRPGMKRNGTVPIPVQPSESRRES